MMRLVGLNLNRYAGILSITTLLGVLLLAGCFPPPENENDLDYDGIPDANEQPGTTYLGLPLYDWGARPNQKDLFVEIDYMNSADEATKPREEALQKVVAAFAAQGIAVHFDVGNLYDQSPGYNPARFDLGGGNQVPFADSVSFSVANPGADADVEADYKAYYQDAGRKQIFYYSLFGSTQNGEAGSSGIALIRGTTSLITLGEWGLNSDTAENTWELINLQAMTLMHEFGHNLGLRHGGNVSQNWKPNYTSIMNYHYFLGLPELGSAAETDRVDYYCEFITVDQMSNSVLSPDYRIDYSYGNNGDLNEAFLDEALGLNSGSGVAADFDCNTFIELTAFDITGNHDADESYGLTVLRDYNDWDNLYFWFAVDLATSSGATQRTMLTTTTPDVVVEQPHPYLTRRK